MSFIPLASPLPTTDIVASVGDVVDALNSTTTTLGSNATYTGTWVEVLKYTQIAVISISDQNSATDGVHIQFSSDGTNVDHSHSYTYSTPFGHSVQAHTHARYYRISYTNGAVAQTSFRLQTVLRPVAGSGSIIEVGDIPTGADDALLTKSILVGQTLGTTTYSNVRTNIDGSIIINQHTQVDPLNSTTTNLAAGATFTGATITDLNLTAVQFIIAADQNCLVHIDQSSDGVNWDVSDTYDYFAALGGSGQTAQLVGSYYRMRVTNIGSVTTTFLRFQAIQVPFLNPLPRSLDLDGHLQVGVKSSRDDSGFVVRYSPDGQQISIPIYRLLGQAFCDTALDTNFWTASVGTGGTTPETGGALFLSTGTTANNAVSVQSIHVGRFAAATYHLFRSLVRLVDPATANNTRRWGAYTTTDGTFFEVAGTTFRLVTRKASVDTVVANGSFNGKYGSTFTIGSDVLVYEIIYDSEYLHFMIDNKKIHTIEAGAATWSSTLHLPVRYENINSGGLATNISMEIRTGSISRLGLPNTQPVSRFQSGTTAGLTLKSGPGNLHSVILSAVLNNSIITLYDNTTATGTILWSSGALTASSIAYNVDFKGITFNTGLTLVISGANANVAVLYE